MATTIVKTIGNGTRDYTSIQAWEDAAPANLVTADQVWEGQLYKEGAGTNGEWTISAYINISGSTTDSTRFKRLKCASGQSFSDSAGRLTNALRYNAANGVAIRQTNNYGGSVISVSEANAEFDGLQMQSGNAAATLLVTAANPKVKNSLIHSTSSQAPINTTSGGTIVNSITINSGGGPLARATNAAANYIGGTLVRPSGADAAAVSATYGGAVVAKGCAVFGSTNVSGFSSSSSYNATDQSSFPGTNNRVSLTFSNQFKDVASLSTLDLFPKAGNGLQFGLTDSNLNGVDVFGQTRAATPTIGAVEFVSGGGGASTAISATTANTIGSLSSKPVPRTAIAATLANALGAITSFSGSSSTTITASTTGAAGAVSSAGSTANGTFTSEVLKDYVGNVLASVALNYVRFYNDTTGALVLSKTGVSTNASGIVSFSDAALVAGQTYRVDWETAAGSRRMPRKAAT